MFEEIDPRAYLQKIRNNKKGIKTRSKIIKILKRNNKLTIKEISKTISRSRTVIRRHLKNLEREGIIIKNKTGKTNIYSLSGIGQRQIEEVI
ncbi:MAG: winged helix-turn-helix domain-containing protein [Nitrososphaerota archaeon]